ncbi:hypothetical protein ACOZ0V_004574 [Cronobacter malonaticus]|uniref:hypothetical protein n=1 Tax=Cronobacter malonaticus TaxID=413503 RepID=UPI000CFC1BD2|nr:hypothetical protein [Cronobacter malonaticus]NCH45176.1 hypothetical protein [Cronobacter malonaticus]
MRALLLMGCTLFSSPLLADCLQSEANATAAADFTWSASTVTATPRAHFYSAPSPECRLDAFLLPGDAVQVFRLSQSDSQNADDKTRPFAWVSYRDSKGRVATGWMETAALNAQQEILKPEGVCAARLRELDGVQDTPETANRYEVTGSGRHFFYTAPDAQCRSQQVFLVAGDTVSVNRTLRGFSEATWYGKDGRIVKGWLESAALHATDAGETWREDISASALARVTRTVSLQLNPNGQCIFYENAQDGGIYRLLVREDHTREGCRGAADPEVAPVVANIDIDITSGKIVRNAPAGE